MLRAHNDNDIPEFPLIPKPRAPWRWRKAAPAAAAVAVHLGLAALWVLAPHTAEPVSEEPDAIEVTLIERAAIEPASPSASEEPGAPQGEPPSPVDYAVIVLPTEGIVLLGPGIEGAPETPALVGEIPEAVRLALADALECRATEAGDERADCLPTAERFAQAEFAGLESASFIDPAYRPRPEPGTAEFPVGPVVVSLTAFGDGPAPYRITIKPRAAGDKGFGVTPAEGVVFQAV